MTTFYDRWLGLWDEAAESKRNSRTVIHEEDLEWIETDQDFRIALLAGPENGFRTWGTEAMVAEIPPGSHTGKHEHGEEGIYIVSGEGFSVVNGRKYEWGPGSVLWMPFGSQHQHFNTGTEPVRYFSSTTINLEHFVGLAKLDQIEVKGFTDTPVEAELSVDGFDEKGRRICLKAEDAPPIKYGVEGDDHGHSHAQPLEVDWDNMNDPSQPMSNGHRDWTRQYMDRDGVNGFKNREIELSNVMGDLPGRHGGKHSHMEAMLYILDGEGYTVVDGVKVPWKKGSLLHVQGPQTEHEHYNSGDIPSAMLRIAPGIRFSFFQSLAKERFPYLWYNGPGNNEDEE
jgi:quercetin dioxygenase-like cupin family protein